MRSPAHPRDPPPTLDSGRCVHARGPAASCTACIDVCPRHAWVLENALLGIDPDRCDGCGRCVAACPEGAIDVPGTPLLADWHGDTVALARCGATPGSDMRGRIPCLHALGLRELARLRARGARRLLVADPPCRDCPRAMDGEGLETALVRLAHLLRARGVAPLALKRLPLGDWYRALRHARSLDVGRRALLRRFARGIHHAATDDGAPVPLPTADGAAPFPVVAVLDPFLCQGCDACARGCPRDAIRLVRGEEGETAYEVRPARCSGCGLCVDLCEVGAVTLLRDRPTPPPVPLRERRCTHCRAPFREPTVRPVMDRCRICRTSGHAGGPFPPSTAAGPTA